MKDKRLEYRIAMILKSRNIEFKIIDKEDEGDIVVSDFLEGKKVVRCEKENDIRKVISHIYGKERFAKVVIGIDPGPRPGLVVLGDGKILEEMELNDIEEVRGAIDEIWDGYRPESMIVKIGNGDIVNRNRIVNSVIDKYRVEIVDEKNTSISMSRRNIESARIIALTRGREIRERMNIVIREGYLREIQRKSRIKSMGKITVSRELARRVALGEITLEEAIKLTRDKNEE